MNEQEINNLIDRKLRDFDTKNRFTISPVTSHNHDGINSPPAFTPILTYIGHVHSDGTPLSPMPRGWSIVHVATGYYEVYHNLGNSAIYTVMATPFINPLIAAFPGIGVSSSDNVFNVLIFDTSAQTALDNAFYFALTVVNNRSLTTPVYNI